MVTEIPQIESRLMIVFPAIPDMPIIIRQRYRNPREIGLSKAKDIVLGAVLRNDYLEARNEQTILGAVTVIYIFDSKEIMSKFAPVIEEHDHAQAKATPGN
jgi:hypothetical protein